MDGSYFTSKELSKATPYLSNSKLRMNESNGARIDTNEHKKFSPKHCPELVKKAQAVVGDSC